MYYIPDALSIIVLTRTSPFYGNLYKSQIPEWQKKFTGSFAMLIMRCLTGKPMCNTILWESGVLWWFMGGQP